GVEQGGVAGRVGAAGARRDLHVLDQPGEKLSALGVDGSLAVLGRRPFGVAGHYSSVGVTAARTRSTNSRWIRRSPVSSGWKAVASRFPWRTATILPATRPSTFTPSP